AYSSAANNSGVFWALNLNKASSNTITAGYFINSGGYTAYFNTGSNNNTVTLSSVTGAGAGNTSLYLSGSSSNTISRSYVSHAFGYGVYFDLSSNGNTVTQSTVATG